MLFRFIEDNVKCDYSYVSVSMRRLLRETSWTKNDKLTRTKGDRTLWRVLSPPAWNVTFHRPG